MQPILRHVMLLFVCLLPPTVAPAAQKPNAASRPVPRRAAPWVTVLDLSGRTCTGRLIQADVPGTVRLEAGDQSAEVPAGQVIWIGFDVRPQADPDLVQWFSDPPVPSREKRKPVLQARVSLRDGQVLQAHLQDPRKPDSLALEHRLLGSIDLPLAQLREVQLLIDAGKPARHKAPAESPAFDVLWLTNGDRVEGILHSLNPAQARVELASGEQTQVPTASVQTVRLAEGALPATAPASQPAAPVWLRLRSGERITVSGITGNLATGAVTFACRERTVTIPVVDLVGIEPTSGKWQWLTNLPAGGYEHQPLLAPPLKWQADATASGTTIFRNGNPVLHGIGMPAGSSLRYDVGAAYSRLLVWPILDDSAGSAGPCKARILLDGQPAWQGTVAASASSSAVIVNLTGKRELLLQVEPAAGADVRNRFVWAWPVVVR